MIWNEHPITPCPDDYTPFYIWNKDLPRPEKEKFGSDGRSLYVRNNQEWVHCHHFSESATFFWALVGEREITSLARDMVVDSRIEVDYEPTVWGYNTTSLLSYEETVAKLKAERVKEFHDFIRDHRSQDDIRLNVVLTRKDVCSLCREPWESDEIEGVGTCCANCGALLVMKR